MPQPVFCEFDSSLCDQDPSPTAFVLYSVGQDWKICSNMWIIFLIAIIGLHFLLVGMHLNHLLSYWFHQWSHGQVLPNAHLRDSHSYSRSANLH